MIKNILIYLGLVISIACVAQEKEDTCYCDRSWCPFPKNDPRHFNHYYNGHLCENFNPQQIDFSVEYFDLRTRNYAKEENEMKQNLLYDYSLVWQTGIWQQNGVIGRNYQRIQIHIDTVYKNPNQPEIYMVKGKSKVNSNICDFSGEISLISFFKIEPDNPNNLPHNDLFGSYIFYEDSTQKSSGIFKGIMECFVYNNDKMAKMLLDDSMSGADGYWNRTFVGTWSEYNSNEIKKCIWGDYRLPFVFDFMCGDGEMKACDKYEKFGWQTFNKNTEYIEVAKDRWELKDKWWEIK